MKQIRLHLIAVCLLCSSMAFSQTDVNKDINLAVVYEQVVKEGYGTPEVHLKLANEYYFQGNYDQAKKWYEKVFETAQPTDKKLLFRYKRTLKALKISTEDNPYLTVAGAN